MSHVHDQAAYADRLPVAFSDAYNDGADEGGTSAVGLIMIAFLCLAGGSLTAYLGEFSILMSLLIGWLSSFVGLFAVIACIMLCDTLFGRGSENAGMSGETETDIEMEKLRARWNQNVAMVHVAQHGAMRGHRN